MTEEGKRTLETYAFDDIEVTTPTPKVAIIAYAVTKKVTMDVKAQDLRAANSPVWNKRTDG